MVPQRTLIMMIILGVIILGVSIVSLNFTIKSYRLITGASEMPFSMEESRK